MGGESTIPMIPDNPHLSWATMSAAALWVIDVSNEIGEYYRALEHGDYWKSNCSAQRLAACRRAIARASFEVIVAAILTIAAAAVAISRATQGMDWRMTAVLEGISRLEASWLVGFISLKTPRLIGVYCSSTRPQDELRSSSAYFIQRLSNGSIRELKFHVRYSLSQYFFFAFCFAAPHCGRPTSTILGLSLGFNLSLVVYVARRLKGVLQARIALSMAIGFALLSAILFADGCHYIQTVWGRHRGSRGEWGLGLFTFFIFGGLMFVLHSLNWHKTEKMLSRKSKRLSVHDRKERVAVSLIFANAFGHHENSRMSTLLNNLREDVIDENEDDDDDSSIKRSKDRSTEEPSFWSLFKTRWSTPSHNVFLRKSDIYMLYVVSALSVFVVVVNIGATAQMNVVRQNFPTVHKQIYGNMEEGAVCAFRRLGGSIKTFRSKKAAHFAGYKVAHCGACGDCSDWHNLRLQYTTRTYLAKASARCARMSLIGGRKAVLDCLHDEPIGFKDECAECWATDIFCARKYCAFIFLQSNFINTVANFAVGEDTITSATCEEAMCELEFVPCSGANRRRMHIQSMIKRPGRQLCQTVDVDWADVFAEDDAFDTTNAKGKKNDEL